MPYSPVLIDRASSSTVETDLMGPINQGASQQQSPFLYQGNLYIVLKRVLASNAGDSANVYRSDDLGATWNILDGANAPATGFTFSVYFDGVSTLTVGYTDTPFIILPPNPPINGTIILQDFNLVTQTWGAPYGATNSPAVLSLYQIWKRSDGSLIALFNTTWSIVFRREQGMSAAVFSGGAWGAPFPIDTNISAGRVVNNGSSHGASVVLDASDTLHVFMFAGDNPPSAFHDYCLYQQVLLNNSLGAFHNFAETDFNADGVGGRGNPILVGNQLIYGVINFADTKSTIVVGSPLSNPVFTVMPDPGIDPTAGFSNSYLIPQLAFDGTTIYALIGTWDNSVFVEGHSQLRLCTTTNIADPISGPWVETTLFDTLTGPASFNVIPGGNPGDPDTNICFQTNVAVVNGQLFVCSEAFIDAAFHGSTFWFGIYVKPSPGGMVGGSTGARFKPCLRQGAEWIQSQMAEQLRVSRAKRKDWPYRSLFPTSPDLTVNVLADLFAPAQDGALHTVLEYKVPSGFRFYLDAILQDGPTGIAPGDASWVVDQNAEVTSSVQASRVQGLIDIPLPLGSIHDGMVWRFDKPYEFGPLTVIRSKVMNANIVPGAPNIFTSGFFGFLAPIVKGERA